MGEPLYVARVVVPHRPHLTWVIDTKTNYILQLVVTLLTGGCGLSSGSPWR